MSGFNVINCSTGNINLPNVFPEGLKYLEILKKANNMHDVLFVFGKEDKYECCVYSR